MRRNGKGSRDSRNSFATLALVAVAATTCISATTPPVSLAGPPPIGKVTIAQPQEFLYVDPNVSKFSTDSSLHFAVFDPLVARDNSMKIVPKLAESYALINATTWQFKLRKGVKFHNGEEMTAEDVKFTVERVKRSISRFARPHPDFAPITGAEVVDKYTVNITTARPDTLFLGRIIRMFIVPKTYVQRIGDEEFASRPIGTGAFKFVERVKDAHVKLEANISYFEGPPKIKEVVFRIIPEASTAVAALRAGEVDIVPNLPPDHLDALNRSACCRAVGVPSVRSPFLWIYPESPFGGGAPLKDARVRRALNHAINREQIVQFVLLGQATVVPILFPRFTFAYHTGLKAYEYNPEKARQLLTQAGYPNGFTITFWASSSGLTLKPVEVAQAIASDLAKVGINTNLQTQEFATYIEEKNKKNVPPLFLWSWGAGDFMDPDPYLRGILHSTSRFSLTNDPEWDAAIDQAAAELDAAKRQRAYYQVQQRLSADAIWGFLWNQNDLYGVSKRLNWQPRSDERIILSNALISP